MMMKSRLSGYELALLISGLVQSTNEFFLQELFDRFARGWATKKVALKNLAA